MRFSNAGLILAFVTFGCIQTASADEAVTKMFTDKKFDQLLIYAKTKLPQASWDADVYFRVAIAMDNQNVSADSVMTYLLRAQKLNSRDDRVLLAIGQQLHKKGKLDEAQGFFQKSFMINRTADAATGIALSALKLNQTEKAFDAAESALYLDSTAIEPRMILADIAMQTGNCKNAGPHLDIIVSRRPNELKYWKQLAACVEKSGTVERLALIDSAICRLDLKDVISRRRLIEYMFTKKDTANAYSLCKELAALTPDNPRVFRYLAQIAVSRGLSADALTYLRSYVRLDTSNAGAARMLADMLYSKKDFDGALPLYRRTLILDPALKDVYPRYVEILLSKGIESEAIKAIEGAIKAKLADVNMYIALGDIRYKQKNYTEAARMYNLALSIDVRNLKVLASLADCQAASGDVSSAILSYEQVVSLDPNPDKAYKALGDLQMQTKKTDNAIGSYKKYLQKLGTDSDIAKIVGQYEYDKNNFAEAVKFFELVKTPDLRTGPLLISQADCYVQAGEVAKAIPLLEDAKGRKLSDPNFEKTYKLLGSCYEKTGAELKAGDAYESYVKLPNVKNPDAAFKRAFFREKTDMATALKYYRINTTEYSKDPRSFVRLGLILAAAKETSDEATKVLARAVELVDTVGAVWQRLGQLYGKAENKDKELTSFKKYLSFDPQNFEANRRVGQLLMAKGQAAEAITSLESALMTQPKEAELLLLLAEAYTKTNRPPQAIDALVKAKDLRKNNTDIRMRLYNLYKQTSQADKAEAEIKELTKISMYTQYKIIYIRELIDRKQFTDAQQQIREIVANDSENVEIQMLVAEMHKAQKNYIDALETYKAISFIKDSYAPALVGRADVYALMGDTDKALQYYTKAVSTDSSSARANLGLARINKKQGNTSAYQKYLKRAKELDPTINDAE